MSGEEIVLFLPRFSLDLGKGQEHIFINRDTQKLTRQDLEQCDFDGPASIQGLHQITKK